MIQRLQSVYLIAIMAIGILVSTGTLLTGTISTEGLVTEYELSLLYFKVKENGTLVSSEIQFVLISILALVIGWSMSVLLSFKNRAKQIKLAKWNYLFMVMLILALFAKAVMYIPNFQFGMLRVDSVFGIALLLFMIYLNFRTIMLIKRDEALIKSADRIR
jgi:hypothetical protein